MLNIILSNGKSCTAKGDLFSVSCTILKTNSKWLNLEDKAGSILINTEHIISICEIGDKDEFE